MLGVGHGDEVAPDELSRVRAIMSKGAIAARRQALPSGRGSMSHVVDDGRLGSGARTPCKHR